MRLEERRVLNADAAAVQQLFVDAGAAAGDGHADTFHIQHTDTEIRVSLNGREISRVASAELDSLEIRGSSDDDVVVADFRGAAPGEMFDLRVDGNGGHDLLTLDGQRPADRVIYELNSTGPSRTLIESPAGSTVVTLDHVETVQDQLTAGERVFRMAGGPQDVTIDDAGSRHDDLSRLEARPALNDGADLGTTVFFKNPVQALRVDTGSTDGAEGDTVEIKGLDAHFEADVQVAGSSHDALTFAGRTDLRSSGLSVATGDIQILRDIATRDADIRLEADHRIVISESATVRSDHGTVTLAAASIEVDGRMESHTGHVSLDSGQGGVTVVRGRIDVSDGGLNGVGGSVHVLGATVILDGAVVDATGNAGGGAVLVGGDYQGGNPAIRNAAHTFVGAGTVIAADAQASGTGGKVVVWANEVAQFFGRITARGGMAGGDGGFVEVSGREHLDYRGTADLSAAAGEQGTLLLDPLDIVIKGGDRPPGGAPSTFEGDVTKIKGSILLADNTPTEVYETDIEFQSKTAHIVLEARKSITVMGDFSDAAVTLDPNHNLTLRTHNLTTDGPGGVDIDGTTDDPILLFRTQGSGTITIEAGTVGGAAGHVVVGRLQSDLGAIALSTYSGNLSILQPIVTSGDVRIMALGDVDIAATISARSLVIGAAGDFNGDAKVNGDDYLVWRATFGSTTDLRADANTNGIIDLGDYVVWRHSNGGMIGTVRLRENVTTTAAPGVDITATQIALDGLVIDVGGTGDARFNGPTVVEDATTIKTAGGNITFLKTLDSAPAENNPLTLEAGAGNIEFAAAVGGVQALGQVTINSAARVDINANFQALGLTADVGVFDSAGFAIDARGPSPGPPASGNIFIKTAGLMALGSLTTRDANVLLNSGLSLEIVAPIDVGGGDVRLVARGHITQTATGTIAANELGIRQEEPTVGNVLLDLENDVDVLAARNEFDGGMITFRNANALIVGALDPAGLGAITFAATSGVTMDLGDIFLSVGGALTLDRPVTAGAGNVRLVARGIIDQSATGVISANRLGVRQENVAGGQIRLDDNNAVTQFAAFNAFATGMITYHDVNDLVVSTVDTVTKGLLTFATTTGVMATGGDIYLDVGESLALSAVVNAGAADVRLKAGGGVTQAAAGIITADELGVRTTTGEILLDRNNNVAEFAALAAAAAMITYRNASALTIGSVAGADTPNLMFAATVGVQTSNSDIYLDVGGALTLNEAVNAGTGDVRLSAAGDISQSTTGVITANELAVRTAAGNILLDDSNGVDVFAAENLVALGTITYHDMNELVVGAVDEVTKGVLLFPVTSGARTNNGDVFLNAGATLTLSATVVAGTGDVRLMAQGNVTQSAAGAISANELGVRTTAGQILLDRDNSVDEFAAENLAAGGMITYRDINNLAVETVPTITVGLLTFPQTVGVKTAGGDIYLDVGATLSLNSPVNAGSDADVRLVARGDIVQSAGGIITADELGVRQEGATAGNILLDRENDVDQFAARNNFAGGMITYRDANQLIVETVDPAEKGQLSFPATVGVRSVNGDIFLDAGGTLALQAAVNAGAADVRLAAAGNLTQNAAGLIIANELGVRTTIGDILLDRNNAVDELAAENTALLGMVTYRDVNDLVIETVPTVIKGVRTFAPTDGVRTNNGDVFIDAGGSLRLDRPLAVGTADVRLKSSGDVTQLADGTISANELGVRQEGTLAGDILLDRDNSVDVFAAENLAPAGMITYHDASALAVGAVGPVDKGALSFLGAVGVKTASGDIYIDAGTTLTLNQAVNAGAADVRLVARGNVTQAVAGVVAANRLAVRQESAAAGEILLDDNNAVTQFAAQNAFVAGMITYHDVDGLVVANVDAVSKGVLTFTATIGVSTNNGDIYLDVGGTLHLERPVNAGTADVRLKAAGNVSQAAAGLITADELGLRTTAGDILLDRNNSVNELAAVNTFVGGMITYRDASALTVDSVGLVNKELLTFAAIDGVMTTNGDIYLDVDGTLLLKQFVNAGTADVRLAAQGTIMQDPALVTNVITANELAVRTTAGDILLDRNNSVDKLAALNSAPDGMITYHDVDDFDVDLIAAVNKGVLAFPATDGVRSTNGDIFLDVGSLTLPGSLDLKRPVNAGTANVRLVAHGDVTQEPTGTISAHKLGVRQQGTTAPAAESLDILLDDDNSVDQFAAFNAFPAGMITFHNGRDLVIDSVLTVTKGQLTFADTIGVISTNGDIYLDAFGSLRLEQPVDAGTGDVRIVARSGVTQSIIGLITADELGIRATAGGILLDQANNAKELAAETTLAASTITYRNAIDLLIGEADMATKGLLTFPTTTGVKANNGDVLVVVAGFLTLDEAVVAGTGDVRLMAVGIITPISSAGTITADELAARVTGGAIDLDLANQVKKFSALNSFEGGAITFHNQDELIIDMVALDTKGEITYPLTRGVVANRGDVHVQVLAADKTLTINNVDDAATPASVEPAVNGNDLDFFASNIILVGPTITADDRGSDGGLITFHGAVELAAASFIVANALQNNSDRGGIVFNLAVSSSTNERNTLRLTAGEGAGEGDIQFKAAVDTTGGAPRTSQDVGAVAILSARNVTAMSTIVASSLVQSAGSGTTRLFDNVTTDGPVQLTTSLVWLDSMIISTSHDTATPAEERLVDIDAAARISDSNAIIADGGTIDFRKTLDGNAPKQDDLSLTAGNGAVHFHGNVGSTQALRNVTLITANNVTADALFTTATVNVQTVIGLLLFVDSATIDTLSMIETTAMGNGLNNIGFRGSSNTIRDRVEFRNYGDVTLGDGPADTIRFLGGVSSVGPIGPALKPRQTNLFANIETTSGSANFGKTLLTGESSVNTANQFIQFANTLDSDANKNHSLSLDTRQNSSDTTGADIAFSAAVGGEFASSQRLGDLTIEFANNVTAESTVHSQSFTQQNGANPIGYNQNDLSQGVTQLKANVMAPMGISLTTEHIILHGVNAATPLMIEAPQGNVRLETHDRFNLRNGQQPIDLQDVQILASGGRVSDAILARSMKEPSLGGDPNAFGALDRSRRDPDQIGIQGTEGLGIIFAQVADVRPGRTVVDAGDIGMGFELTIDWREGSPANIHDPQKPSNRSARYVEAILPEPPTSPENFGEFQHLFTTTPKGVPEGGDIPVFVSITKFANGTIEFFTASDNVLVDPDGILSINESPNGIQVVVLVPVVPDVTQPPPTPAPIVSAPIVPPPPAAEPEPQAPLAIVTRFVEQSSVGTLSQPEVRFYQLRIVTLDANGDDQEIDSDKVDLTEDTSGGQDGQATGPDSIYPFHPGKLRELFRRLPDDHYRIYLIEDGTERLMLDFTIQQGRPIETREEVPPLDQDEVPDDSRPDDDDAGAAPQADLVPQDGDPTATTFAQRLGRTALVAHGGIVLSAAALTPVSRARREVLADHWMARFGRHWQPVPAGRRDTSGPVRSGPPHRRRPSSQEVPHVTQGTD